MFEILLVLTAVVILGSLWISYQRTKDPFVPAVIFAPMLAFMWVYSPAVLWYNGTLDRFFEPAGLEYVMFVNFAFVTVFCIGLVPKGLPPRLAGDPSRLELGIGEEAQRVLYRVAWVLGWVSLIAFVYMVYRSGGFVRVFSAAKVYVRHPIGYISALQDFAYPAIALMAVALQGRRLRMQHICLALLFALPQLSVGLLGNRRGPTFLILVTLALSWYLVTQKRPTLRMALFGVIFLGVTMLVLYANRVAERSTESLDSQRVMSTLTIENAESGQEFVYGGGLILTSQHTGEYYWGRSWIMAFVLRPIPTFLWPTLYEDVGFGDMVHSPGYLGFTKEQWVDGAGFAPPRGTAGGFIPSLFREWSWVGLVFAFLFGKFYARFWRRFVEFGGIYGILYLIMLALSVYLVSQSVGAWLYRIMLLFIPTWALWRYAIKPRIRSSLPEVACQPRLDQGPSHW